MPFGPPSVVSRSARPCQAPHPRATKSRLPTGRIASLPRLRTVADLRLHRIVCVRCIRHMAYLYTPCGVFTRFLANDTLRSQRPRRGVCSLPFSAGRQGGKVGGCRLLGGTETFFDAPIGEAAVRDDPRDEHPNWPCASGSQYARHMAHTGGIHKNIHAEWHMYAGCKQHYDSKRSIGTWAPAAERSLLRRGS